MSGSSSTFQVCLTPPPPPRYMFEGGGSHTVPRLRVPCDVRGDKHSSPPFRYLYTDQSQPSDFSKNCLFFPPD